MPHLKLSAGNSALTFRIHPNGWCGLYFEDGTQTHRLGAETQEILFAKLITAFLPSDYKNQFEYQNISLLSVANLMDSHAMLAGCTESGSLRLYHIGTEDTLRPLMTLSPQTQADRITDIISYLTHKEEHYADYSL